MAKRGRKEKDNWKKKRRQEYLEKKEFRYYIFCEGQATEPKYFQGFKRYIEDKGEQLENILNNTFKEIEDITDVHQMTNQQLKRLIQKIEVDKEGNVDIYLRLLGDLGLDESVLIEENETVLNCDDQT